MKPSISVTASHYSLLLFPIFTEILRVRRLGFKVHASVLLLDIKHITGENCIKDKIATILSFQMKWTVYNCFQNTCLDVGAF